MAAQHERSPGTAAFVCLILLFAVLSKAAHDLWAATPIYVASVALFGWTAVRLAWRPVGAGWPLPLVGATIALLGAFTVSFLSAANSHEAFLELADWAASAGLLFVSIAAFRSPAALRGLFAAGLVIVTSQAVLMGVQWARSPGLWPGLLSGSLLNPNLAAGLMVFWLPVFARAAVSARGTNTALYRSALGGLVAAGAVLIAARSVSAALIALLITPFGAWGSFASMRRDRPAFVGLWAGLGAVSGAAALVMKGPVLFGSALADGTSRLVWWRAALEMWRDHPWRGVGLGNFPSAYLAYAPGDGALHTLYPHSFPIGLLSETGLAGVAGFFLFVAGVWWLIRRHPIDLDRRAFLAGVAGAAMVGSVNIGFEYFLFPLTAAVFLGAALAPAAENAWTPRKASAALIAAAAVAAIPAVVAPFVASQNVVYAEKRLSAGAPAEALAHFGDAARLDPRSWQARRGQARALVALYRESGNRAFLDDAVDRQREATDLNRLNALLHWELGRLHWAAGTMGDGFHHLKRATELHPTNKAYQASVEALRNELFGVRKR